MSEQMGRKALIRRIKHQLPQWGEALPEIPSLAYNLLKRANEGNLELRASEESLEPVLQEIRRANERTTRTVLGSALLICAALLLGLDGYSLPMLYGAPIISWALALIALVVLSFSSRGER